MKDAEFSPNCIKDTNQDKKSRLGLVIGGIFGLTGLVLVGLATPFILPALRKHCLPYVPATDNQLTNLSKALRKHAKKNDSFLDIGSGDGRICRLAADQKLFSSVHGVELNYMLVIFSRFVALKRGEFQRIKYFHKNLWQFPLHNYDAICIFGVESMMDSLERHLSRSNVRPQTIFACRYPFSHLSKVDEIGQGIDTIWIYKLYKEK